MNNTLLSLNSFCNLANMKAEILEAATFKSVYFNDFLESFKKSETDPGKTYTAYKKNLRQFAAWLYYKHIIKPVKMDIQHYREFLISEHDQIIYDPESLEGWSYKRDKRGNVIRIKNKANTAAQYLRTVSQFFKWTAQSGLYPNIAEGVRKIRVRTNETHRREAFTADEVLKIEEQIKRDNETKAATAADQVKDAAGRMQRSNEQGKRLQAIYLLAVNAGLRTIEISRADIKDFVTRGGVSYIYIWGKGHEEADAKKPIAPEVAEAIKDYLRSRTDRPAANAPLFVATGNRSGGKRLAPTTISTMLKKAMQSAGYDSETLTAHSLRHTAGTLAMKATGNNIYTTQKYMRHENPTTTEIYLHTETEKEEINISRQLYNLCHGIDDKAEPKARIEQLLDRLNPEKLAQLAGMAEALAM